MNETIDLLTNHRTYRQFDSNYQLSTTACYLESR